MSALIETQELEKILGMPQLRILDASWYLPAEKRDARAEFNACHLPGAVFFDIDAISDHESPYPHMLPASEAFAESMSGLCIGNDDLVVVYDGSGLFSAPRAWWMLRIFGHAKVAVLNGGLPKWKAEGRRTESGAPPTITPAVFTAQFRPELLRGMTQIQDNLTRKNELLLDARSPGRFGGTEPEPRPGLASGHIPGSVNLFFKDCLSPPFNTLKPPAELAALFEAKGVEASAPLVATCGSGVTACILALALYELGNKNVAVYDGAWAEWGSRNAA